MKAAVRDHLPDATPITLADGTSRPLGTLRDLVSIERGQKIAYVTDVADMPDNRRAIDALVRNADILFIEAALRRILQKPCAVGECKKSVVTRPAADPYQIGDETS